MTKQQKKKKKNVEADLAKYRLQNGDNDYCESQCSVGEAVMLHLHRIRGDDEGGERYDDSEELQHSVEVEPEGRMSGSGSDVGAHTTGDR